MKQRLSVLIGSVCVMSVVLATPALAQSPRQFGLVMNAASGGAVGVVYNPTETVSIRPEFSFTHESSKTDGSTVTSKANVVGVGASALFYVAKWNDLSAYLSPRFVFHRATASSSIEGDDLPVKTYTTTGSIGVEQKLGDRFTVFGEFGLDYGRTTAEFSGSVASAGKHTATAFGTRSAVGVTWMF